MCEGTDPDFGKNRLEGLEERIPGRIPGTHMGPGIMGPTSQSEKLLFTRPQVEYLEEFASVGENNEL